MGVEDTLEGLRAQVEELVGLLTRSEAAPEPAPDRAGAALELDRSVSRLATRLDQAGELLAMLTDLLETQADRLEALEERVEALGGHETARAESAGRTIKAAKAHPTVLVVDDLPEARTLLSIYLSKTGYQVVTASSAEDCLAKLRHHEVDAIVLDAELSGANGDHVLQVIREEDCYADKRTVPVIVYTAYPGRVGRDMAAQWGATEYVVKGGDMLPLMSALIRHTSAPRS